MGRHKHREWGIAESQFYVANILFIQPINLQIEPNIQMGTRITLVCPGKCFKEKKKKQTLGFGIGSQMTRKRKLWEETNRNNYVSLLTKESSLCATNV